MPVTRHREQRAALTLPAKGKTGVVVALGVLDVFVAAAELQSVQPIVGDEVDDTRDRIRTIRRGCPVLQHFDATDGGLRDQIGVRRTTLRRRDQTPAIQQHQRTLTAQVAQVYGTGTLRARALAAN